MNLTLFVDRSESVCWDALFAGKHAFENNSFEEFIEAVSAKEWHKAGEELLQTQWCSENKERCLDDKTIIVEGCGKLEPASIVEATTFVQ